MKRKINTSKKGRIATKEKATKLGNPLVIAGAMEASKTNAGQKAITDTTNAIKIAFLVAGGIFLTKYGIRQYKKYRARKYAEENAHRPEVQASVMLHNSMFSGTLDILGFQFTIPDGTDEGTLNRLALQVDSLEEVSKAYKILFDRVLLLDVQSELNSEELHTFFNRLQSQGTDEVTPEGKVKPYNIGEPIWCRNKQGVVLKKAVFENDRIKVTDESKGRYGYAEKIGVVEKVFIDEKHEIFYVIDRDYRIDSYSGYGYVNHRNVMNRNPDKI